MRVESLVFGLSGFGCPVSGVGFGFRFSGFGIGLRVRDLGFRVRGLGFWGLDFTFAGERQVIIDRIHLEHLPGVYIREYVLQDAPAMRKDVVSVYDIRC